MPLDIKVKTFGMAREEDQLKEITDVIKSSGRGDVLLFPEYGAYTLEGSRRAYAELSEISRQNGLSVITTLNLPSDDLPGAAPGSTYNTLFIFSRNGEVYSPQAKITPQSFEMRHLDESYPKINVAPYSRLNKVTLRRNDEIFKTLFFICSDLYVLPMFGFDELESDIICCPANFGNGAEGAAGRVIDYSVNSGLFKQGFFCNTYQKVKENRVPLTLGRQMAYPADGKETAYNREAMKKWVLKSSVVYPDDEYHNFQNMLKLTRRGTFTVPQSRSFENGLEVKLGDYERVVEL